MVVGAGAAAVVGGMELVGVELVTAGEDVVVVRSGRVTGEGFAAVLGGALTAVEVVVSADGAPSRLWKPSWCSSRQSSRVAL